jgi:O6-methylguanine-DNA--protein-cysteine methyltransferase
MVEDYFNSPNTKSFIFSLNLNSKNEKVYQIYNPLLFACVAISCTDLADGINVDPNALSVADAQAKNIFPISIVSKSIFPNF